MLIPFYATKMSAQSVEIPPLDVSTTATIQPTKFPPMDLTLLKALLSRLNPDQKRELNAFIITIRNFFDHSLDVISEAISQPPTPSSSAPLTNGTTTTTSSTEEEFVMVSQSPVMSPVANQIANPLAIPIEAPKSDSSSNTSLPLCISGYVLDYNIDIGIYTGLVYPTNGIFMPQGKGKVVSKEDQSFVIYEGEFKDGEFHGQGVFNRKPGSNPKEFLKKNGIFEQGRFVQGTMERQDGTLYAGQVQTDEKSLSLPHGQGELLIECVTYTQVYRGEFKEGLYEGFGVIKKIPHNTKTEILCCEGTFKNGLKHGKMLHYFENYVFKSSYNCGVGDTFVEAVSLVNPTIIIKGSFEKNIHSFDGHCEVKFENCVYSGFIKNNKFNCSGSMEWTSGPNKGMKFEGFWTDHHFGQGTLYYPDGAKYYGSFDELNKPSGNYASIVYPNGRCMILGADQRIAPLYSSIDIEIPSLRL